MQPLDIAVIGGTGPQGRGLAYRFAHHGHRVAIGSRSADRAEHTADEIRLRLPSASVDAGTNADVVDGAELVVVAVPYEGHRELIRSLHGKLAEKIVVSCVNPLGFDAGGAYGLAVPSGSAAEEALEIADDARVVGAFHHVSAVNLWADLRPLEHEDVLVCGDDAEAKAVVVELARTVVGHDGVDVGALRMARILEPLTAVLIGVNKRYRVRSGIALTGLPTPR